MAAQLSGDVGSPPVLPFAADSAVRRVHAEGVLLLGGGRALLLQIAHPAVAKGVAEHSSYRTQRWRRLVRTLRPMYHIVFGSRERAQAAAASINRVHEHVTGEGYDSLDPDLLLWVLATLIDTTLELHERCVGPLAPQLAEAYYADMRVVGHLLQIPEGRLPADLAAFRAYFADRLTTLEVSDDGRAIARDLLKVTPLNWPAMLPLRLITAGLLPDRLRGQYGLGWGPKREALLLALQRCIRAILPRLPGALRRPPWFLMPPRP